MIPYGEVLNAFVKIAADMPYCIVHKEGAANMPQDNIGVRCIGTSIVPRGPSIGAIQEWVRRLNESALVYERKYKGSVREVALVMHFKNGVTLHAIYSEDNVNRDKITVAIRYKGRLLLLTPFAFGELEADLEDMQTIVEHAANFVDSRGVLVYNPEFKPRDKYTGGFLYKIRKAVR